MAIRFQQIELAGAEHNLYPTIAATGSGQMIQLQSSHGYLQLGSNNSSYAHLQTDRPNFYFNQVVKFDGNISGYDGNESASFALYYDSQNTAYYVDPNGGSEIYNLKLKGAKHTYLEINPGSSHESMVRYMGSAGTSWYVGKRTSTQNGITTSDFHWYSDAASQTVGGITTSGILQVTGSHRAPIFYDSNDTTYYLDPASTSTGLKTAGEAEVKSLKLGNGFALTQGGANYANVNSWIYLQSNTGLYAPANSAHIYPNATSDYGAWRMDGARNNWNGITFAHSGIFNTLMSNNVTMGLYNDTDNEWYLDGARNSYLRLYYNGTEQARTDNGFFFANNQMRSPIFYDSADTTYYADPAGTSVLYDAKDGNDNGYITYQHSASDFANGTLVATDIVSNTTNGDSFVIEVNGKSYSTEPPFAFKAQGYIYDNTFYNIGGFSYGKHITSTNQIKVFDGAGGKLHFWWPRVSYWNSFEVRVRNANGADTTRNRVTSITNSTEPSSSKKSTITLSQAMLLGHNYGSGSAYAAAFYDSGNTNYYVNPESGSVLGGTVTIHNDADSAVSIQNGGTNAVSIFAHAGDELYLGSNNASKLRIHGGGAIESYADFRAPIFYDSNDTAYYLNPAGASHLGSVDFSGILSGTSSGCAKVGRNHAYDTLELKGYGAEMMIGGQHQVLHINYRTCNNGASNHTPQTWYWRDGTATGFSNHEFDRVTGHESVRSPIFYDSNNTAYYLDPAGTSTSLATAGKWFMQGSHNSARIQLNYAHGSSPATDSNSSALTAWVSEPGITYNGAGIGVNIHVNGQYYGRAYDTQYGAYIRFDKSNGAIEGWTTQGNAGVSGGQGTKRWHSDNGGNFYGVSSVRSPIFYDSGNTAYYIDPANTGLSINVAGEYKADIDHGNAGFIQTWRNTNTGAGAYVEHVIGQSGSSELRIGHAPNYGGADWNASWVYAVGKPLFLKSGSGNVVIYAGGGGSSNIAATFDTNKNATFAGGVFAASGSVGSQLYALELTRSGSGTSAVDMWGSSNTLVLGHSASAPVITINSTATTFAGNIAGSGHVTLSGDSKAFRLYPSSYDNWAITTDSNGFVVYNETDSRYDLKISGTGTATFAGNVHANNFHLADGHDIGWAGGFSSSKPTLAANGTTIKMYPSGNAAAAQFTLSPTVATFAGQLTGESYVRAIDNYQIVLDAVHSGGPIIEFGATNNHDQYGHIGQQSGEYQFGTHSRDFAWYNGSTRIMELDAGNTSEPVLAIGTSVAADNTKATLQVFGNNNTDGTLRLGPHSSKGTNFSHIHNGSNGDWYIRPASNSGSVYVKNYVAESDARLKENIVDNEYGLSEISQLKSRNFNWLDSPTDKQQTGFVAQEVEKVVPKWVTQSEGEYEYKSVDYQAITSTLVKAVQELKAQNEDLLARVKALESK